jgi:hypothetical protein
VTAVVARRTAAALFLAALVLATVPARPRNWETWPSVSNQPARPVGADANVDPVLTPGARLVRGQILDARGGTP